jgi:hypothetical protein
MKRITLLALAIVLMATLAYAKTIQVTVCDICETSLADDKDYFAVEHVMSCDNDPGTKHLCSVDCLVAWANDPLRNVATLSFDTGGSSELTWGIAPADEIIVDGEYWDTDEIVVEKNGSGDWVIRPKEEAAFDSEWTETSPGIYVLQPKGETE